MIQKTLLCLLAICSFALAAQAQSKEGQLTMLTSMLPAGAESDLEFMVKASSCKWTEGPSSLDPKKVDPELLSFIGGSFERVKRICQGRVTCDVGGVLLKSHKDIMCNMKADSCDAYQCFKSHLENRVAVARAFAKEDALKKKIQSGQREAPAISSGNKNEGGRD